MAEATVTSKGQITIPQKIREFLGLHAGDLVNFVIEDDGRVLLRPATIDVRALNGMLKRKRGHIVSVENMNKAMLKAVCQKK